MGCQPFDKSWMRAVLEDLKLVLMKGYGCLSTTFAFTGASFWWPRLFRGILLMFIGDASSQIYPPPTVPFSVALSYKTLTSCIDISRVKEEFCGANSMRLAATATMQQVWL